MMMLMDGVFLNGKKQKFYRNFTDVEKKKSKSSLKKMMMMIE